MKMLRAGVAVLGLSFGSTAMGALDWGFIDTGGSPDFVRTFDLAAIGTNVNLGQCATNFNRGMDFDTPNSFYYFVSTDALNNPGDRGLWYWNNGVNTQLATIGFSDSTDGDATLSNDGTKFYVAVNDQDATAGHSLYVFENLGGAVTFTEIGETGLSQLIGIAMDPISGNLFGYDSGTEALYKLDLLTGQPSLIGASGMSLGAIGGMDFSADGSTLLLSNARNLLFVNKNDGSLTPAGDAILNISALSYRAAIPEPGSAALAGAVGLLVLRRRRY